MRAPFSPRFWGPRRQAERRLERFHMLTKRALSAEWEKSLGSFSEGLLYAGGKMSFSRFRSRFLGKERRLPKAVWAKKLMASGLPEPRLGGLWAWRRH